MTGYAYEEIILLNPLDNARAEHTKKSPEDNSSGLLTKMADTYSPTFAVPSARTGLTSLFGMGRGGTPLPNHLK